MTNMTTPVTCIYMVRHAESDSSIRDDRTRPLTEAGRRAAERLVQDMADVAIQRVYSSPYQRARDTVAPLASAHGLPIIDVDSFRERRIDDSWIEDFASFSRRQWEDFHYKLADGECLSEVQARCIAALMDIVRDDAGLTSIVGTHGTALATMLNYYDPSFNFASFERLRPQMPYVVRFIFEGEAFQGAQEVPLAVE